VAEREPWELVWIDGETFEEDIHAMINCTSCHLGQSVDDMDLAHEGMLSSPTADPVSTCGQCHPAITESAVDSLHYTLEGYDTAIYGRTAPEDHPAVEEMESYHCNSCHATCGDCHVSQPASVGGGLVEGHVFQREPSMFQNCTACHGSRINDEYRGLTSGHADVHYSNRMTCSACHTGDEMHGVDMTDVNHRYDGGEEPACISCHEDQVGVGSGILQHELHGTESMSCQTCHSIEYNNCTNCHVERTDEGIAFFSVESYDLDFAIGKNTLISAERPWEYVTVRHVPIDHESFSFYDIELTNFDSRPTWVYSTPHNIQRNTPQTESCTSCHYNDEIFLTADRVVPEELAANASVIVTGAPPLPEGYEEYDDRNAESTEDFFGGGTTEEAPATDSGGFWGDAPAEEAEPTEDSGGFWGDAPAEDEETDDTGSFWGDTSSESDSSDAADDSGGFWGESNDSGSASEDDATQDDATDEDSGGFWGS